DDLPCSMTLTARASDAEESLLETDLTIPVARRAGGRTRAFLRAASAAFAAWFVPRYFDLLCCAERGFFERQIQIVTEVGATLYARAPAATAKEVAETEDVAKDVAEIGENVRVEASETTRGAANTRVTKAVIASSLLRVR